MAHKFMKIVLITLLSIAPLTAIASSNKPLAENIALLAVAKRWCSEYEVDLESGVKLAVEKGINPLKGQFNRIIDETKTIMEGRMEDLGVKKFCQITYERYKPGGPVPGFMMKK